MRVLTVFFASIYLFFGPYLAAQTANLSVINQSISADMYTFSLMISASGGDIYLGNSDFNLTFNPAVFGVPTINQISGGDFGTESGSSSDAAVTQDNYLFATATSISGSTIRINVSGPNPASQLAFERRVAKIPSGSSVTFGTFTIMGYQGSEDIDLQWANTSQVATIILPSLNEVQLNVTTTAPAAILPVDLLYFKAEALRDSTVQLDWATASEKSNAGFEIHYSRDAVHWQVIRFVPGKGTTVQTEVYMLIHSGAAVGPNYYRLKQIDLDGHYEFSDIRAVVIKSQGFNPIFSVHPNPATDTVNLFFETGDTDAIVEIMDLSGKLLAEQVLTKQVSRHTLSLEHLSKGIYFIRMKMSTQHYLQKLVLQ